ncbi:Transmembrane protein 35A [Schistosoma japonicum]|nr:Transmembrane protein 35A [Schistosoma japonicum]
MSNTALTAISVAIGVFFVFFGTLKLGPLFSDELYRSVRKNFLRMFKTFPFSSFTGWNPNPHVIRRVYGTTEVVGGIVLATCSGVVQDISNVILLSLMVFHLFCIWRVADGLKEASNLIVLCLMLTCRFIIRIQVSYSYIFVRVIYCLCTQLIQKNEEVTESNEFIKNDIRRRIVLLQEELQKMNTCTNSNNIKTENDTDKVK